MKFAGLFKAATLCCLALGFSGQSVGCAAVEPATSMKDMLDFLIEVYESEVSIRHLVYAKLHTDIAKYCNYSEGFHMEDVNKYFNAFIHKVLGHLQSIRANIVKQPSDFGKYSRLIVTADNAESCADNLVEYFPKIYSTLYFLFFNGSKTDCEDIKGGTWSSQKCIDSKPSEYLGEWLTDKIDKEPTPELIKRGFTVKELSAASGQTVTNQVKYAVNHTTGGSFQHALHGTLFLGPWHDAKTAYALLFLDEFCVNINNDKLKDTFVKKYGSDKFKKFKDTCG